MENTREAKAQLKIVAQLQAEFWDALSELESLLGAEIDSNTDLTGYGDEVSDEDLNDLIESGEEREI